MVADRRFMRMMCAECGKKFRWWQRAKEIDFGAGENDATWWALELFHAGRCYQVALLRAIADMQERGRAHD